MKQSTSDRTRQTLNRVTVDESVWDLALERMDHAFDLFDQIAVMFSGGKDSTATLQVALAVAQERGEGPLRVVFYDEEAIPYQTENYMRRIAARDDVALEWNCVPIKCRNACSRKSPFWYPWNPAERDKWVRPLPPEALTSFDTRGLQHHELNAYYFDPSEGSTGMAMGIRAQESLTRLRAVTRKQYDNYIVPVSGHVSKIYPVYDWTDEDVWTAPYLFGWDYNRAYDVMDQAGVSRHGQRCSPPFGEEPLEKLWTYHVCFPEIWDKMIDRAPGVATAARYARTELYAYRGRPEKPDGVSWVEFLHSFIEKHTPKHRKQIAQRIQYELKHHYMLTKDPIVDEAPHPLTGVSWDFLLAIAIRGDLKNRKQAGGRVNTKEMDRAWEKYNRERAARSEH